MFHIKLVALFIITTSLSICAMAAPNEVYVINDNGDKEIFIEQETADGHSKYISSGTISDLDETADELILDTRPKIMAIEQGNMPQTNVTISNEYEMLKDAGGDYDSNADVYRPDLEF